MVQVESLHAYQHHQSHFVYKSTTTVANKESSLDSNAVFKAYKLGLSMLSLYGHLRNKIISAKMLSLRFLIYYIVVKLLVISLLYMRLHLDLDDNCNFIMEYSPPW